MLSSKVTKVKPVKVKKEKRPKSSESSDEEEIHDLSFYMNDRVKLMKEVIKLMHPKKIKAMAPGRMKVCYIISNV